MNRDAPGDFQALNIDCEVADEIPESGFSASSAAPSRYDLRQAQKYLECVVSWDGQSYISINYKAKVSNPTSKRCGKLIDEIWLSRVAQTPIEAVGIIAQLAKQRGKYIPKDIYVCMASQVECAIKHTPNGNLKTSKRERSNAAWLQSLFMDIDVKDGAYERQEDAIDALWTFCEQIALPYPTMLVGSGTGGVHAYWTLTQALSPDEFQPYANALAHAATDAGLHFDSQCTVDAVRVLRIPGTFNYKVDPPANVILIREDGGYLALEKIAAALDRFMGRDDMQAPPAAPRPALRVDDNDELSAGIISGAALRKIENVAGACPWILDTLDTGGAKCNNPLWFYSLGIAACCESPSETAHWLSERHSGYLHEETEQEIQRKLKDRAEKKNIGFTGCRAIKSAGCNFCDDCAHLSLGKSPLTVPGALPSAVTRTPNVAAGELSGSGRYQLAFNTLLNSKHVFAYDAFHYRLLVDSKKMEQRTVRELRNEIINASATEKDHGKDPGKEAVFDATFRLGEMNAFDPVVDELLGLEWDAVPRIDAWLIDYCGVADTPLNRAIGRKFMIGMVRRAIRPGCKFDTALILESPQGSGKSSLAQILAGSDENFLDSDPTHLSAKEQQEQLRGRWIVELGELSGMRRADINLVKAFMSRTHDRGRPAYGRVVEDQPRRCVFIGTTNESEYLKDDTGNRRFWPVKTGVIDIRCLSNDRELLLAEAVALANAGEDAVLPQELWADAAEAQEARRENDPWEDILAEVKGETITFKGNKVQFVPSAKILGPAYLNIPPAQQRGEQSKRARKVMERLGWQYASDKVFIGGNKLRGYVRAFSLPVTAAGSVPAPEAALMGSHGPEKHL